MAKGALFLVLGLGLIAAGIVGVTTAVVVQKNDAAVKQLEQIQEKMRAEAREEQKKLEDRQKELEKIARDVEADRKRFDDERRRQEDEQRAKKGASEDRERAVARQRVEPPKRFVPESEQDGMRQEAPSRKLQEPGKQGPSYADSRRPQGDRGRGSEIRAEELKGITRKASLEVARSFRPVEYYSRKTRQLVVAEPFDYSAGWMRVRIRVWKSDRLIKDDLVRIPLARWYQERMAEL